MKGWVYLGVTIFDGLTFIVNSAQEQGITYFVDLEAYNGNGCCDCPNFQFNLEPWIRRGSPAGNRWRCKHIQAARRWICRKIDWSEKEFDEGLKQKRESAKPHTSRLCRESQNFT